MFAITIPVSIVAVVLLIHAGTTRVSDTSRQWQVGTYAGLTMGKATYKDVLRKLGQPKGEERNENDPVRWYVYEDKLFGGKLIAVVRKGKLIEINIYPLALERSILEARLGLGPGKLQTYDFLPVDEDSVSAPMCEASDGAVRFLEYRARGVAALLGADERIHEISFLSSPIASPLCRASEK
jgi:hypothetical protein